MVSRNPEVFHGLLHDCSSTNGTDEYQEPKPDVDKWVHFCFKYKETLGNKLMFIEFIIDWDEWFDVPEAKKLQHR
jgi:hypothetical protein